MASPLKDIAIKCALDKKWDLAIEANLQILEDNSHDIDTWNRLGFAYMQTKKFDKSESAYKKVLERDATNPIAIKNIKKVQSLAKGQANGHSTAEHTSVDISRNDVYIEEAGKTKTVELKNVADKKTLSSLQSGEIVMLVPKRSKIFIQTSEKKFIGMLPDNIGMRLTSFIQGGNEYQACIKSVTDKNVVVFIKEVKKVDKFKSQPSFVSTITTRSR
jgi:tetratricopeptide (TPR) repeat protein